MAAARSSFVWYELMTGDVAAARQVPGGGWIVQAADPQGASFALLGARK